MKNHKVRLRIIFISLTVVASLVATSFYFLYPRYQEYQLARKEKQELDQLIETTVSQWKLESKYLDDQQAVLDINGDGIAEKLVNVATRLGEDYNPEDAFLLAYNYKGEEVGRTPEGFGSTPPTLQMRGYKLNTNDPKEYLAVEFVAGPHQSETMLFGLDETRLLPICSVAQPDDPQDCLFYAGNVGGLMVEDIDGNGFMEIVEVVDEYPADGQLNKEEIAAIDTAFGEFDVADSADGMKRIAIREKGGRGRKVAWAIHSYNGAYFEPQVDQAYDKFFELASKHDPDLVRKSDISPDSLEYNEFVKGFWSGRQLK